MNPWKRFAIAAVLVVGVLATVSSSDEETPGGGGDTASEPEATEEPTTVGLNQPARDGKFEFVVKGVDCSRTSVGDEFLNKQAQGKFCLVAITVKNIGDEPQSLFGDNQYLFDGGGRKFSADSEAAIYLEGDSKTLYEEINPGNQLDGTLVFDVPQEVEPAKIELHDSSLSGGVAVTLA